MVIYDYGLHTLSYLYHRRLCFPLQMALYDKDLPLEPERILTRHGKPSLKGFFERSQAIRLPLLSSLGVSSNSSIT